MRSTCAALQLLASALGSYLAAALVSIVQVRPLVLARQPMSRHAVL